MALKSIGFHWCNDFTFMAKHYCKTCNGYYEGPRCPANHTFRKKINENRMARMLQQQEAAARNAKQTADLWNKK